MPVRHGWLTRPLAFLMCLGCGVAAIIVLIEALRPYGGTVQPQRSDVAAPLAERANTPFPRVIRDASGASLVIPHKPQRIISQTLGTDEILLAICAPQRLVALSILVDDTDYSNVTAQAHLVKARANADAEQILALDPDVIFVASYSKAELIELLQAARAPVFRFTHFDRLEDIKANIRTIGYAVGEDANADALVQHMEHHLAQILRLACPKTANPCAFSHMPRQAPPRVRIRCSMICYKPSASSTSRLNRALQAFARSAANNSSGGIRT